MSVFFFVYKINQFCSQVVIPPRMEENTGYKYLHLIHNTSPHSKIEWCTTRYTARRTPVPHKFTRDTKVGGAWRLPESSLRSTGFYKSENQICPALIYA